MAGGMSFGSPFGAPAATHDWIVSICSSLSERSFLNFWMPTVLSMCHGGIWRVATRSRIERAQGRASSYVASDIGAMPSVRWQASHLAWKIGAMSLVNVGALAVCAAAGELHSMRNAPAAAALHPISGLRDMTPPERRT